MLKKLLWPELMPLKISFFKDGTNYASISKLFASTIDATLDTGHVTCFPKRAIFSEDIDYDKFVGILFLVMSEEKARDISLDNFYNNLRYVIHDVTALSTCNELFHHPQLVKRCCLPEFAL